MKKFIRDNSLSLTFALLFAVSMAGQTFFGYKEHLKELSEGGADPVSVLQYLSSGHFLQATFENWESEFLQMALLVVLTIFLQQKGSSESKDFDTDEPVDREPDPLRRGAPWPVRQSGWILAAYKHSLTIALLLLFAASFAGHFYGSLEDENLQLRMAGKPAESASEYLAGSRFWFESFQNWQSEFLSIFAIIILSIFLRQNGSSQSKPVDAPNSETGE
ncbi:DUF6766 family protein [Flavobacterium qiangtangense]|uniref:DUF6766 family protein n=1 Tax=Flavobacterium qiangtangense TaxID=1442595 RepID=A0ABW1PKB7_9FLAO